MMAAIYTHADDGICGAEFIKRRQARLRARALDELHPRPLDELDP